MLVAPILEDNRAWRANRLDQWQVLAEDWRAAAQNPEFLLRGSQYLAAASPRRREDLTETEQAYLKASAEVYHAEGRRARLAHQLGLIRMLLRVSLLANLALLILLLYRR
jgi:hypothetical protein